MALKFQTKFQQLEDLEWRLDDIAADIDSHQRTIDDLEEKHDKVAKQIAALKADIAGVSPDEYEANKEAIEAEYKRQCKLVERRYGSPRPASIADWWRDAADAR